MDARKEVEKILKQDGAVLKRSKKHEVWELSTGHNFIRAHTPSVASVVQGAEMVSPKGDVLTQAETNRKIMRLSEKQIQDSILGYLKLKGIFSWRNNTGSMMATYKGKVRRIRFGFRGVSDILGIAPLSHGLAPGRFFAIEVKRAGKTPTADQQAFLDAVKREGGIAIVARSLKDVQEILG